MDAGVFGLIGALIGAAAGVTGTVLIVRHQIKIHRLDIKRDAYLAFVDAVDAYHSGLLEYSARAENEARGVGSRAEMMEAVKTLKATQVSTRAAYRRLGLFGDTPSQKIGEETLGLILAFPEIDLAAWATVPGQIATDQQRIENHADEVEKKMEAFVQTGRADLGFDEEQKERRKDPS